MAVAAALTGSSVSSAAVTGFGVGVLGLVVRAPRPTLVVALLLAIAALVADLLRVRPLAVHRQVPQAWGRIFPPAGAAALYGARLGVGPLTILTSWQWWAMLLIGAGLGVWPSVALGVLFAATRVAATIVRSRVVVRRGL